MSKKYENPTMLRIKMNKIKKLKKTEGKLRESGLFTRLTFHENALLCNSNWKHHLKIF